MKLYLLIRDCIINARLLQKEKINVEVNKLKEDNQKLIEENKRLGRIYNSACKLNHYRDRAVINIIKDSSIRWKIGEEISKSIVKYENLTYKELIDKNYDCL